MVVLTGCAVAVVASAGAAAPAIAAVSTPGATAATAVGAAVGTSSTAGATAGTAAAAAAAGPVGWIILGADDTADATTWDCWKPLLHDTSTEASSGMLLRDVLLDTSITVNRVIVTAVDAFDITVTNQWGEMFSIAPVALPCGAVAAHAARHHV